MIKSLGVIWGILFMLGGILGFVPGITQNEMFLGVFMVNAAHGVMHILSGAIFLIASTIGARYARAWFRVSGTFYAALAVVGFQLGNGMICGLISNNQYDSWGHGALALALLLIGFAIPEQSSVSNAPMFDDQGATNDVGRST